MSLRQLKWLTIVGPLAFLALVEIARRLIRPDQLPAGAGDVLLAAVVLAAALLFSGTIFGRIERMQASLARQNRELLALHEAGLDVAGELGLELVLQKVVDHATNLIGARYGVLSVPGSERGIPALISSGLNEQERARLGPETIERALAVPIVSGGQVLGNLYLADKQGLPEFTSEDRETLARFATQAALAIQNARLHRRVRDAAITEERERIAREMHDSLAQVLGYVMTKAQAVQELLKRDEMDKAAAQVAQLSAAARGAYADVREAILALRTSVDATRGLLESLAEYVASWKEQSDIEATLTVQPDGERLERLEPVAELQLLRIVQEALTNVRKHAEAQRVGICITAATDEVEVIVADDGRGFDPASKGRDGQARAPQFGLATMRERAESVGGSLRIESAPDAGTRVIVRMPV